MSSQLSYIDINVQQKLNVRSVVFLKHSTKQFWQTHTLTRVIEEKNNYVIKLIQVSEIPIYIYCGYTTLNCFIWTVGYGFSIQLWGQFKIKIPILYACFITHIYYHNFLTEISMCNKNWMYGLSYGQHRTLHAKQWAYHIYSYTPDGSTCQESNEWWPLCFGN